MTTEENVTRVEKFHLETWISDSYAMLAGMRRELHNTKVNTDTLIATRKV